MTRILIIEDDAITAKEIVTELSSRGLEVDWVDNGREGLVRAVSGHYDLITLDRMLPEVNGLAIVTTLRALDISTPILMISALSGVDERVKGSIKLLDLAWHEFYRSTDADYRYASLWVNCFADSATLIKKLYEAGVQRRDDENSPDAVENLLGTDSGEFEAFCVYHRLGEKMASAWEYERGVYGHETYKGP
jgi:CheY-like chemotaxis protein